MRCTLCIAAAAAVITGVGVCVYLSRWQSGVPEPAVSSAKNRPWVEDHSDTRNPAQRRETPACAPEISVPLGKVPAASDPPEVIQIKSLDPRFVEAMSKELELDKLLVPRIPESPRDEEAEPAQTVVSAFGAEPANDGRAPGQVRWMPRCGEDVPGPTPRMPYAADDKGERGRCAERVIFQCPLEKQFCLPRCPADGPGEMHRVSRDDDAPLPPETPPR
jgi:hypothetical protein